MFTCGGLLINHGTTAWTYPNTPEETEPLCPTEDRNLILMQFIGLSDKNGKEIYEGDIIACSSHKGNHCLHEIVWNEQKAFGGMGNWNLSNINGHYDWIGEEEYRGNIYETPNLLK